MCDVNTYCWTCCYLWRETLAAYALRSPYPGEWPPRSPATGNIADFYHPKCLTSLNVQQITDVI